MFFLCFFMFFLCFTDFLCGCFIDLFSCIAAGLFSKLTYLLYLCAVMDHCHIVIFSANLGLYENREFLEDSAPLALSASCIFTFSAAPL